MIVPCIFEHFVDTFVVEMFLYFQWSMISFYTDLDILRDYMLISGCVDGFMFSFFVDSDTRTKKEIK